MHKTYQEIGSAAPWCMCSCVPYVRRSFTSNKQTNQLNNELNLRSRVLFKKLVKTQKEKFHHRVHNIPPRVPVPNQVSAVHTLPKYFFKINFNIILHSILGLPSCLLPSDAPTNTLPHKWHMSCLHHSCFIIQTVALNGAQCGSRSSWLCSLLLSTPLHLVPLSDRHLTQHPIHNTLSLRSSLNLIHELNTRVKEQAKLCFRVF